MDTSPREANGAAPGGAPRKDGRREFQLAIQRTRLLVYALSAVTALAAKAGGVIQVSYARGVPLLVVSLVSALLFDALYRQRVDEKLGLRLEPFWMAVDVFIITWGVWLTGGAQSPWFLWYLSNTGAAAFVSGAGLAVAVAAANTFAYLGVLTAMGHIQGLDASLWLPVSRMTFLYCASFFFLRGVTRLKESRALLKELQAEQALKLDELIRLTQDLDQGTRALAEANVQIREADRVKSQFLANMSHELRTPLNSIIGFSEILLERLDGQVQQRYTRFLQNIHSSGQHLLGIINDILDLSKVEAGKMELVAELMPVRPAVDGVLSVMHGMAAKQEVGFAVDIPPDLPVIETDPAKFKQILYNLLSNAVKFSPRGSKVTVRARVLEAAASPLRRDALTVSVEDQGIGISPGDQEIIFHEFRQADGSSTRAFGGTGLGLALVKKFVEFQGGAVSLRSEVGQGSTFSFTLPMKPLRAGEVVPALPLLQLPSANRVLVIEDDMVAYEALGRHLTSAGYFPIRARHGEEALTLARTLRPVAITLDLHLPDLSGWEVLKELKAEPATREVPVVIISLQQNRELGLTLGASDYFVKPVDRLQLLSRLRELAPPGTVGSRLLLVDDDPAVHEMLDGELSRLGYTVDHARSGAEGLEMALLRSPDAVVLDLMMPDMSGFEVAEALRQRKETEHVPIVVLTAKDLSSADRRALHGKINALVQKGQATPSRLVAAIRSLGPQAREGARV